MEFDNFNTNNFKVLREFNIDDEDMMCIYIYRCQLHDIVEFVSIYQVVLSSSLNYINKYIFGFEEFDEDDNVFKERFCFAPDSFYKNKDSSSFTLEINRIVLEYYEKKYTEKTGRYDYDNIIIETEYDCGGLFPEYDKSAYFSHKFFLKRPMEELEEVR